MDLAGIRELIAEDMRAVDALILRRLHSDVVLINQVGQYIVGSGGKRLRPMVVLLAARALGYGAERHIDLAAVIEFIHTATLLHDDVVDGSEKRRNRDTANAVWGNATSVLVGDFLYSRAFEMMVDVNRMRVMEILSHATNRIAEGEVLQLLNCHDADVDEQRYREVILRKTATIHIGLTDQWFAKRRRAIAIGWFLALLSIGLFVVGVMNIEQQGDSPLVWLVFVAMVLFIGALIYGLVGSRLVTPKRISDRYVWLKGVNPQFLGDLPPWPHGYI